MAIGSWLKRLLGNAGPPVLTTEPATNTLAVDIQKAADWISLALRSLGYDADFSAASMKEIERFFREQTSEGEPVPGGLLSVDLGSRLFALGSYCGETLRRELGGEWLTDDDDPEGEIHVAVQLAGGNIVWPIERVMKRLASEENNIAHWAASIREAAAK